MSDGAARIRVAAVSVVGAAAVGCALWARSLEANGTRLLVDAAPFVGAWDRGDVVPALALAACAVAVVVAWPVAVERLGWRPLLVVSWALSMGWALALAVTRDLDAWWRPLTTRFEYLPLARRVDRLGPFLATFVERLPGYPTHVRGHPPGPVVGFWGLARLGFGDVAVAAVVVAVAALAAPAVLHAVRSMASVDEARRIAPYVVVLPAAVWWSSVDAALMGVAACATAALASTVAAGPTRRRLVAGAGGGLLAGLVLASSYGAPTLLAPLVAVAGLVAWRSTVGRAVVSVATVASLVPIAALALAGFSWFDGFAATRTEYWAGAASTRPYGYFVVANLVVAAIAVGPAAVAGAVGSRRTAVWLLPAAALLGALAADLSGYSKGEVERIWLPLVPWLAVATIGLPAGRAATRRWLGAQLLVAVALQTLLRSPW